MSAHVKFLVRRCLRFCGKVARWQREKSPGLPAWAVTAILVLLAGCQTAGNVGGLPSEQTITREQLIVHSNFNLPKRHRLLDELDARRTDIAQLLELPTSDEPVNIYLFDNEEKFRAFIRRRHPMFPNRRALFVKNDTSLNVYAYWGDRVAEDLRHEVTHGYLHSVVPNLPLWLDEGTAEYFEVTRGKQGFNPPHIYLLADRVRRGEWTPNLTRLEELTEPELMTQLDYAEAWLWVHFLLDHSAQSRKLLQAHFHSLTETANADPLSPQVDGLLPNVDEVIIEHLGKLAQQLE